MIFSNDELDTAELQVGAIYEGGPSLSQEPLGRLMRCGNMGGIRPANDSHGRTAYVVLYSTGKETDWPDGIDQATGAARYFGDNRTLGNDLLSSSGNRLINRIADLDLSTEEGRRQCPPFFMFTGVDGHSARSVRFEGLAVPGTTASGGVWSKTRKFSTGGGSYLNYEIALTLLADPVIHRSWLSALRDTIGNTAGAPVWFDTWRRTGRRVALAYS